MNRLARYIREEYRCPISNKHVVAFEFGGQREEAAHRDPREARRIALQRLATMEADHCLGELTAAMFAAPAADRGGRATNVYLHPTICRLTGDRFRRFLTESGYSNPVGRHV